jgi:hypothetical protein
VNIVLNLRGRKKSVWLLRKDWAPRCESVSQLADRLPAPKLKSSYIVAPEVCVPPTPVRNEP